MPRLKINQLHAGKSRSVAKYATRFLCCVFLFSLLLSACSAAPSPTPFIAPRSIRIAPSETLSPVNPTVSVAGNPSVSPGVTPGSSLQNLLTLPPNPEITLTAAAPSATATGSNRLPCSDALIYIDDLTYRDGTIVGPGQPIEKQWKVKNNGSCDWDERYKFKLSPGDLALGAPQEIALTPTLADTLAVITINFIAPLEPGNYRTSWRAYNAEGVAFGDALTMDINVSQ